ncbi:hypothetical protein chiPu_0023607 [Chiloscyllium punctatum]|uniref:Uncharacterized protein n=1 Tax=Chiloscyllium punctatum TaxID=137246 RepID=A0A401TA51_CHIPU|nr:hypothetical protein [Chiloscyllium punctatum]
MALTPPPWAVPSQSAGRTARTGGAVAYQRARQLSTVRPRDCASPTHRGGVARTGRRGRRPRLPVGGYRRRPPPLFVVLPMSGGAADPAP